MHAVVTVTGKDNKGLIAKISAFLAEKNANIEDISQTILGEYFAMVMLVDMSDATEELAAIAKEAAQLGEKIGLSVHIQHEDIFKAMHNI